jgi:hypothetical protein
MLTLASHRFSLIRVENKPSARPDSSTELRPTPDGLVVDEYAELFYMRLGRLSFRQRWIKREVSPSLTAVVALLIALGGFLLGFVVGRLDGVPFAPFAWYQGVGVLGHGVTKNESVPMPLAVAVPVSVLRWGLHSPERQCFA